MTSLKAIRRLSWFALALAAPALELVACADTGEPPGTDPLDANVREEASTEASPQDAGAPPEDASPDGCSTGGFCPLALPDETPGLTAVWGPGGDDVWVAGEDKVLHWDGATWSSTSFATGDDRRVILERIWGFGPDDVWVAGRWGVPVPQQAFLSQIFLAHGKRSGGVLQWSSTFTSSPPEPTSLLPVKGFWGASPSELWLTFAGFNPLFDMDMGAHDAIYRVHAAEDAGSDGGAVAVTAERPTDAEGGLSSFRWTEVTGFGAADVWAGGWGCPDPWCYSEGRAAVVAHWDGHTWTVTRLDPEWALRGLFASRTGSALWIATSGRSAKTTRKSVLRTVNDGRLGAELFTHPGGGGLTCQSEIGVAESPSAAWFSNDGLSGGILCRWNGTSLDYVGTAWDEALPGPIGGIWAAEDGTAWIVGDDYFVPAPEGKSSGFVARRSPRGVAK